MRPVMGLLHLSDESENESVVFSFTKKLNLSSFFFEFCYRYVVSSNSVYSSFVNLRTILFHRLSEFVWYHLPVPSGNEREIVDV